MSNSIQYNTSSTLLANVMADVNGLMGGGEQAGATTSASGTGSAGGSTGSTGGAEGGNPLAKVLSELGDLLKAIAEMIGGGEEGVGSGQGSGGSGGTGSAGGAGEGTGSTGSTGGGDEVIAGSGRIWGDPHFEGQDGDRYDVQGEAGKTYNLLSDKNFQMNGRFDAFGEGGATVVGEVGISAGSDQIDVSKDGSVTVNGRALQEGDTVELADGGSVAYEDGKVSIQSGEWKTDISFEGTGDTAHLNIDVSTENANADGVKPHGLLGQTFDADDDKRTGDAGSGAQGGGAIEGSNGNVTAAGDKSAVELYEVDDIHDRNFENFNQFFDRAEADPAGAEGDIAKLLEGAFQAISQSILLYQQSMQQRAVA